MLRIEPFDAGELIDRIKARHHRHLKNGGKGIGVVGEFGAANSVRKGKDNADIIAAIATTNRVDLDQEVVLPEGGVFDYLLTNRKIFIDHCYDLPNLVGGLRSWMPWPNVDAQRGWQMTVGVLRNHPYPVPDAVLNIAQQIGIGTSIAFERLEGGAPTKEELKRFPGATSITRKWYAIEASFTAIPCNVDSQSMAATVDKSHMADARRVLSLIDLPLLDIAAVTKFLHLDERRKVLSLVD